MMEDYTRMMLWLDRHFETFAQNAGVKIIPASMVNDHLSTCWQYEARWKENGVPFAHGICVYLLTFLWPYSDEVRNTSQGWVDPCEWVMDNYHVRFLHLMTIERD